MCRGPTMRGAGPAHGALRVQRVKSTLEMKSHTQLRSWGDSVPPMAPPWGGIKPISNWGLANTPGAPAPVLQPVIKQIDTQ